MLSYQSLMPAAAGTPRYENWRRWLVEAPAPPPLAGDKPQRYLGEGRVLYHPYPIVKWANYAVTVIPGARIIYDTARERTGRATR